MKDDERDALFARARGAAGPTEEDRRRVREKIGRRLAGAAGATAGLTTSAKAAAMAALPTTAASAISAGLVVKGAAVALALVAAGVGLRAVTRAPIPPKPPAALVAPSPIIVNPVPGPGPVAVPVPAPVAIPEPVAVPVPGPVAVAAPGPVAVPVPAPASPAPPEQELALIQAMQLALRDGDPQRALSLVREHELRFPSGVLTPEREGAKALALCAQFPPSEAAKVGRAFLDAHPRSPLAARVESACTLPPR